MGKESEKYSFFKIWKNQNFLIIVSFSFLILVGFFYFSMTGFVTLDEITNETATLSFNTTDSTNSTIDYGTTTSFGSTLTNSTYSQNHTATITGLDSDTLYYYNLTTCNSTGTCSETGPFNFTTLANGDTTAPNINFTYPTPNNGSTQNETSIFVNLSTSDTNEHYSFVDSDNSLVLWMRMDDVDGSGDPVDLSSYGNDGTLTGNAFINESGYWGNGTQFDGDGDYINLGTPES